MSDISRWRRRFWFTVAGAACGCMYGLVRMSFGERTPVALVLLPVLGAAFGLVIDLVRAIAAGIRAGSRRAQ